MSSYRNRRIRAQKKRHAQTVARLKDRVRTFDQQGRLTERSDAQTQLHAFVFADVRTVQVQAHTRRVTLKDGTTKDVLVAPFKVGPRKLRLQPWVEPKLGLAPTSLVLEKEPPKVHGVNAQRETRSRTKVGGAGGKKT